MRIARKLNWADLSTRMAADLPEAHPGTSFAFSAADVPPVISWHEGPSQSKVAETVGNPAGWDVVATAEFMAGPDLTGPRDKPLLVLTRSYSDEALAIAVVRFQASNVRPYSSENPRHLAPMAAIVDVDDPARCDYPIVAAMARLLVAEEDAGVAAGGNTADRLSARLSAIGYDTLWNRAWLEVDL